jgi:iron(III) transport system substrate-binding protein
MTKGRVPVMTAFLLAGIAAALPVSPYAAPSSVEEIANYQGADRQAVLEAGAKKEGVVLVYGALTQETTGPVFDAFTKKYPFVRLEKHIGDSLLVVRQAIEEYRAQHYIVDVMGTSLGGMMALRDNDFFGPHWSPEHAAMRPGVIEPKRYWAVDFESYISLGYNTKEVADKDVPKTLDDLLDPKWKGKMAVTSSSALPQWIGAAILDKGEPFVRKFSTMGVRNYKIGGRALSNLVVSGEVPLSPTIYNSHMFASAGQGASVAWRPLGTVVSNQSAMGLARDAPHPHAGMLLVDFFFGKEGQTIRHGMGYASGRKDIDDPNRPEKAVDLTANPNYAQDFERWQAIANQVFGKAQDK